jgi:hypothetical protein
MDNAFANAIFRGWQPGGILTFQAFLRRRIAAAATSGMAAASASPVSCRARSRICPKVRSARRVSSKPALLWTASARIRRASRRCARELRAATTWPDPESEAWISRRTSSSASWRLTIEFRSEFFNLPNHPILASAGHAVAHAGFFVIAAAKIDFSQIQFALKDSF